MFLYPAVMAQALMKIIFYDDVQAFIQVIGKSILLHDVFLKIAVVKNPLKRDKIFSISGYRGKSKSFDSSF
jgi:hypothetical protein